MAISNGIIQYLESENIPALIKWPNDIYIHRKKIAGILIENSLNRNIIEYSVVGIGLNVNQEIFQSDAPNPTSMILETESVSDINNVFDKLLLVLENQLKILYNKKLEFIKNQLFTLPMISLLKVQLQMLKKPESLLSD